MKWLKRLMGSNNETSNSWFYSGRQAGYEEGKRDALIEIAVKNGGVSKEREDEVVRFLIEKNIQFTYIPDRGLIMTNLDKNRVSGYKPDVLFS